MNWSDDEREAIPFQLTEQDRKYLVPRVARAILCRIGRENAIKAQVLAKLLGLEDDRKIRVVVRELIAAGHAIAATVRPPYGFFVVRNREEAEEYEQTLASRAREDFARLRDFRACIETKFGLHFQPSLLEMEEDHEPEMG